MLSSSLCTFKKVGKGFWNATRDHFCESNRLFALGDLGESSVAEEESITVAVQNDRMAHLLGRNVVLKVQPDRLVHIETPTEKISSYCFLVIVDTKQETVDREETIAVPAYTTILIDT